MSVMAANHCDATILAAAESLRGYDLRECVYRSEELKLPGKNLSMAKLQNTQAEHANFEEANMTGADMTGAKLNFSNFTKIQAQPCDYTTRSGQLRKKKTVWDYVDVIGANFNEANLESSTFFHVDAADATFRNANLKQAAFNESLLVGANFRYAKMIEADFENCSMEHSKIEDVDATDANFNLAELENAHLEHGVFRGAIFSEATLEKAHCYKSDFRTANMREVNMQNADLREAILFGVDATDADFTMVNLQQATMERGIFQGVSFIQARMQNTKCKHAYFVNADLRGANLQGADLRGANFQGADLQNAQLQGADVRGADLRNVNVSDADFSGAIFSSTTKMEHTLWLDAAHVDEPVLAQFVAENATPSTPNGSTRRRHGTLLQEVVRSPPERYMAMDVIEGDVSMTDILASTDRIAFWYINQYYVIDRQRLLQLCNVRYPTNTIVYPCLHPSGSMSPENVVKTRPLMKLGAIGLPMNYAYMDTKMLIRAAQGGHKLYEVVATEHTVPSVVSRQVLKHHTNMVSGSHCQEGQGGVVYVLKRIRPKTPPPSKKKNQTRSSHIVNKNKNKNKRTRRHLDSERKGDDNDLARRTSDLKIV